MEMLRQFFSTDSFMPHGHCYLWKPELLWMQVLSNGFIGLSYLFIAGGLVYLVRKGQYLPFKGMALAFGLFIVTCGFTHYLDVYVIWNPAYWLDSGVRVITAIASVGTALMLPPLIPKAVALARGARAAHERGIELEAAVEDLGRLYEKAKQLDDLKTQFFANVSHELRTPLTLILGPMEKMLASGRLDEQQRRDAEVVLRNAQTLLKHVNDLLDVSRLEARGLAPEYGDTDLAELVRTVAAHFEGVALERGMRFQLDVPAVLRAEIDKDKTQRILLNLLSNAFKFTPEAGQIRVSLKAGRDGMALLEVADDGPGIALRDRGVVFERFRQLDGGSTRRQGGTGLGLTIVKDFAELQGGWVEVAEAPEGGALFQVALPLKAPAGTKVGTGAAAESSFAGAARQAVAELGARPQDFLTPSLKPEAPLVLVVEDSPDMNRFVCGVLEEDWRVENAFDGRQGLEKALALHPDLIVSDIMMPRMSGDQMVAEIRRHPELEKTPIILLTAKDDEALRLRLLQGGVQDYVTKPFAAGELKARAANLITMKRVRDALEQEIDAQISDLALLAREVASRKRELGQALERMREAREQAERASRLKTDFLGLVSHELRSPLAVLKLQLHRLELEETDLTDNARSALARMQSAADRLQALIEALLHRSRHHEVVPERFDLPLLAGEVIADLREEAEERQLTLRVEAEAGLPSLVSDPRLVRLVLQSLVGNAVKFTDHGTITLALGRAEKGALRAEVIDTGPGISPEDQARIFEPFEQVGGLRHKHRSGLGLGLTLVRDLMRDLGGNISLTSRLGEGSRFTVIFPPIEEGPDENQPDER